MTTTESHLQTAGTGHHHELGRVEDPHRGSGAHARVAALQRSMAPDKPDDLVLDTDSLDLNGLRSTLWIDVTTILRWDRPVVGVVRVEERLARWVLQHAHASVRFCRFDGVRKALLDVEPYEVASRIALYDQFAQLGVRAPATGSDPSDPKKKKKKNRRWRAMTRPVRKALRRIGAILPNQVGERGAKAHRRAVPEEVAGQAGLQPGDVYVSVGSDWDDKDLRWLYRFKKAHQIRVLGICYDTIPIKYPHLTLANTANVFSRHLADLAWLADHIMCISHCTQRDLQAYLASVGVPIPETSVLRLGGDLSRSALDHSHGDPQPSARQASSGDSVIGRAVENLAQVPFVLFVSTIEKRKNHETLYKAWVRLIEAGCNVPDLVFVGMRGWGVDDLLADLSRDPRIKNCIHLLHHISDAELSFLYEHCDYTVYPSLYEGWGLPVVESFAHGKFCLCSSAGSLREAGGDFAEYLDPWDINAWVARIRHFSEHPEEIQRRNQDIAAVFRVHPWSSTSMSLLQKAIDLAGQTASISQA